jgi:hypothetical protein
MILIDLCKIGHFYCPKFLNLFGQQVSFIYENTMLSNPYFWSHMRLQRHQVEYLIANRIMQVFFLFNLAIHILLPSILLLLCYDSMSQRFFDAQPISFTFFPSFLFIPLLLLKASNSHFELFIEARFGCSVDHFNFAIEKALIISL